MSSLFEACKNISSDNTLLYDIGGYLIQIEVSYDESLIVNNVNSYLGDIEQNSIYLVKTKEFTNNALLTVANPKKSLVIYCDKFINNGTISMTGNGPNVLPHDYHIIYNSDGFTEDIIIPAYANNAALGNTSATPFCTGVNGNNGINRQCGSGGTGAINSNNGGGSKFVGNSGSGYAFGGGAGSGGETGTSSSARHHVDTVYPMRGGDGYSYTYYAASAGVGNPSGNNSSLKPYWNYGGGNKYLNAQNKGVGGRIIIFCNEFTNNGTIEANGVNTSSGNIWGGAAGGASGGGAIDVFYDICNNAGTIIANEGISTNIGGYKGGDGGKGSITLSQISLKLENENNDPVIKPIEQKPPIYQSGLNTNIFKNPHDQYLFDLSYLGVLTHERKIIEINQQAHYFHIGDVLYYDIKNHKFNKATAKNSIESEVCGVVSEIIDIDNFVMIAAGEIKTTRYTFDPGTILYLSDAHEGKLVSIQPAYTVKQIATQLSDGIMIDIQRGYRTPGTESSSGPLEPYTQDELDEIIKNVW